MKNFINISDLSENELRSIIEEAKLSLDNVLRVNAFVTSRKNFKDYMCVRDEFFKDVIIKPASTLVVVAGFTRPEFLVEIEILAQK